MRARYTGFVLRRRRFLERSWHPSTRPEAVDLDDEAEWLGLTVDHHSYEEGDDRGEVTFTARYRDVGATGGDAVRQLVEHGRFVREDDCWFYLDAVD